MVDGISVNVQDFRTLDQETEKDLNEIKEKAEELDKWIVSLIQEGKNFISDFHELPADISAKESYGEEWQNYIEKEAGEGLERIQSLNQILQTIHEKSDSLKKLTENMSRDLENDRELFKQVIVGIEEEGGNFEIETGRSPEAAD